MSCHDTPKEMLRLACKVLRRGTRWCQGALRSGRDVCCRSVRDGMRRGRGFTQCYEVLARCHVGAVAWQEKGQPEDNQKLYNYV